MENLQPIKKVTPQLLKFCQKVIPLAFDESMSYYEVICALRQKVLEMIEIVNNNAEAVIELQKLFIQLQDYVDNYFKNLDVQEEINNKLDQMLADGSLGEVILQALDFKLDKITMDDISGITITTLAHTNEENTTTYYLTKIPYLNKNGKPNELKQGFKNNQMKANNIETVRQFSKENNCKLAINCGVFNRDNNLPISKVLIQNGVALTGQVTDTVKDPIAIMNDGTLKAYKNDLDLNAEQMIADGVKYCCTGFFTLVENGQNVYNPQEPEIIDPLYYQRQIIAQTSNKDIYILSCDGKNYRENLNQGLSIEECLNILEYFNIEFAYMLDGGGSTSLVYNNIYINQPSDDDFTSEREIPIFWYIENNEPASLTKLEDLTGDIKHEADVNKANMLYQPEFHKNEIRWFEYLTQPVLGIRLFWSDVSNKLQLTKTGIGYYNYDTSKYILNVDSAYNEVDYYMYGESRYAPKQRVDCINTALESGTPNPLNNLRYSHEYFVKGNVAKGYGLPTENDYFVVTRLLDSGDGNNRFYTIQIAYARSSAIKPYYRWAYDNTGWTNWANFS